MQDAEDDSLALLEEINATREHHLDISALQNPATFEDSDIDHAVPRQDETYQNLDNSLIPHPHITNAFLLRFMTFDGLNAYQTCSRDIDMLNLHKTLHHIETADPVFSAARDWSCTLQALPGLPKEVRWVLATVYNFACVMLHPRLDEDSHWAMRPWLIHWYDVADSLFLKYGISAASPDPDWCSRPLQPLENQVSPSRHNSQGSSRHSQHLGAASTHLSPISRLVQGSEEDDSSLDFIDIAVGHPSELFQFGNDRRVRQFDPAPGGQVFSQSEPRLSASNGSITRLSFTFNPMASVFVP
ncbi:GTPase-activator for ras GTPase [Fusarium longipes]|uniref:GTPase-activator for ras GTPase n=1 Tax=Fusarium longipes TaxID=694270 RepID=A0A395SE63_9HYPO|nr:GTPase-activator for ras GTPase [Fusarium longipes]